MNVFAPTHPHHSHPHLPSSRRHAISDGLTEGDRPALQLAGRPAPGLLSSAWILMIIVALAAGLLHGTIDTAIARWF